jgi:hypothetical protein
MIKFLLIVGLILYCVYKIGTLFFKAGAASQQYRNQPKQDFNQNANGAKKKEGSGKFKGGEYIDYEEIK